MSDTPYIEVGDEMRVFEAAAKSGLSVLLKGPTGCGKTKLVEHAAKQLGRPLFTVACHEDLTAADLVGRYLLEGGETVWRDGPLTRAVREGGICYLDEVVEARADTTVVLHPLADHRRELHLDRRGEVLKAPAEFSLVLSYNPGYQSVLKDLKESTRQRMVAIELTHPPMEIEQRIVAQQTALTEAQVTPLVQLAQAIRKLDIEGLPEVASTRTLVSTGMLVGAGLDLRSAARAAISATLSDDAQVVQGLEEMIQTYLPE